MGLSTLRCLAKLVGKRFCHSVDAPEWIDNPDFASSEARSTNRDALNAEINAKTRAYTSDKLIEVLIEAGVPCGEINTIEQAFENPQVKHLNVAQASAVTGYGGKST